ncbi:MAG: GGDEF domain-containing protein [Fibrobacteres bacterium]|nr:GGDEF domain-containing protein [Fibrobacterota bacterium]
MDSAEFYLSILENIDEGVLVINKDRTARYWSRGAERLTGFTSEEVKGMSCPFNCLRFASMDGKKECDGSCNIHKTFMSGESFSEYVSFNHKEGHKIPVQITVIPWYGTDGKTILGAVELIRDASDLANMEKSLETMKRLSLIDLLTEAGNRRMGEMRLATKLEEYHRYGVEFGILFIDIDHFKQINDEYGHDTGDRVLRAVAKTIRLHLRSFDDLIRWGGEEFLCLISSVNKHQLADIAEKVRKLVSETVVRLGSTGISVTVSLGAALVSSEDTLVSLVGKGDQAMYESKKTGRNKVTLRP